MLRICGPTDLEVTIQVLVEVTDLEVTIYILVEVTDLEAEKVVSIHVLVSC